MYYMYIYYMFLCARTCKMDKNSFWWMPSVNHSSILILSCNNNLHIRFCTTFGYLFSLVHKIHFCLVRGSSYHTLYYRFQVKYSFVLFEREDTKSLSESSLNYKLNVLPFLYTAVIFLTLCLFYFIFQDISLMRDAVNRLDSTMSQKVEKWKSHNNITDNVFIFALY